MNKLTADRCRQEIAEIKKLLDSGFVSLAAERHLQAYEIALPELEQQSKWIECCKTMPKSKTGVLVGCWFGREWATKWASYIPGHPDANPEGWLLPGASWVPTHWQPLPAPPQQPPTDTYRQIENDGWIEWKGGLCPVEGDLWIEIRLRSGLLIGPRQPYCWVWEHGVMSDDIIAYRVIENDGREG